MTLEANQLSSINSEVLHITSHQYTEDKQRFVCLGSVARGIALGQDVDILIDPQGRRFLDVDVIDRAGELDGKYSINHGHLDALHTRTLRPTEPGSAQWGFYDNYQLEDRSPLATFPERSLGLAAVHFSASYPDSTVQIPDVATLLALSNVYSYSGLLPKHQDQLAGLAQLAGKLDPEFEEALETYKDTIASRYPLSTYMKLRRSLFNAQPTLASSIQDGALSTIGKVVRSYRRSAQFEVTELHFDETN